MKYLSVSEIAKIWGMSDRTVRNYCANGKMDGAFLTGKTWNIPENASKPNRKNKKEEAPKDLLERLKIAKDKRIKGGLYHRVQIDLTYNSNQIEGSKLTHDQTRYIYETNTIGMENGIINVDDIIETINHFRAIDYIIDNARRNLSSSMIKELHKIIKNSTSDSKLSWFNVGEYKKLPNEVGGKETCLPENVSESMKELLKEYENTEQKSLEDILDFHQNFESIHPFQDGNGRVGRLIMFKECLKNNIVPFIIDENHKIYYYRGLSEWKQDKGFLIETCLSCQDKFKAILNYFRIEY